MTTRHDFYQTDTELIVSIYKKGVPPDTFHVEAQSNEVEVFIGQESILRLSPLSGTIVPERITHKVFGTKIELKLPKATAGNWSSLVGTNPAAPPTITVPEAKPAATVGTEEKAASGKKKNWDSLAKEIDGADEEPQSTPDDFFKSLYSGLDADSQRAMLKSYQESGGTVLSTNWREVGTKYQEPQPPAGVEIKKS